ncbi:hypothetical protein ABW21_db0204676 [Orbilia brochopaga]|nr:hypothetical protein ABW21_db0204676 [Drechslerella brochopaga]
MPYGDVNASSRFLNETARCFFPSFLFFISIPTLIPTYYYSYSFLSSFTFRASLVTFTLPLDVGRMDAIYLESSQPLLPIRRTVPFFFVTARTRIQRVRSVKSSSFTPVPTNVCVTDFRISSTHT